jgi:hypothetical protein
LDDPENGRPDPIVLWRLRAEAGQARAKGNLVRAALLGLEALQVATDDAREAVAAEARGDVVALARRLDAAVTRADEPSLIEPLFALARVAARPTLGGHLAVRLGVEARLLYDLQNACIAHERDVRRVDVAEWALTRGRRPIVRSLAPSREVRVARAIRAAERKLQLLRPSLHAPSDLRALRAAVHRLVGDCDARARAVLGPRISAVLADVGLRPASVPEEVARTKLVDELVDLAVARGRFGLGALRDALSRNDLKLPDLRTAGEFWHGDPLLRADRALADALDGVYRRGEIYLRGLQKVSSLAFGTRVGRFLSLYAVLPLLGAFVLLEGLQHVLHPLLHALRVHVRVHLTSPASFAATAAMLFALLHSALFRAAAGRVVSALGWVFTALFVRLPMAVARLPPVKRALRSEPMTVVRRLVFRPVLLGAMAWLVLPHGHARRYGHGHGRVLHHVLHPDRIGFVVVALGSAVLFASRYGSAAEEMALDYAVRSFRHLRTRVIPGVVKAIAEVFAALVEGSERLIYTVDERLRFHQGESRFALVAKGALGLVWGFVAFWIRIYVNLLIEPQVNPIKHFPVVTVSHKIILPMSPVLVRGLITALQRPLGKVAAAAIAGPTVLLLPGVFGFLAWEFKENWKLYNASRPAQLRAAMIGHHGETMAGLLKPGFHSGTIPKLSAKIRRAARDTKKRHAFAAHLLEVEEAVHQFLARELGSLLGRAPQWHGGEIVVRHVELGSNRVRAELSLAAGEALGVLCLAFEEQSGWIVAGVANPGFLDALDAGQRAVFELALAGLYARAAVDLSREQIESLLAGDDGVVPPYDVADEGLLVWPGGDYAAELVYPLEGTGTLAPRARGGRRASGARALDAQALVFARQAPSWRAWVAAWSAKEIAPRPLGPHVPSLLPARRVAAARPVSATVGTEAGREREAAAEATAEQATA